MESSPSHSDTIVHSRCLWDLLILDCQNFENLKLELSSQCCMCIWFRTTLNKSVNALGKFVYTRGKC
jgi:hypothetical protein